MRIKNLNITSFGKLEDVSIGLDDKITVISGKNEAGKSSAERKYPRDSAARCRDRLYNRVPTLPICSDQRRGYRRADNIYLKRRKDSVERSLRYRKLR